MLLERAQVTMVLILLLASAAPSAAQDHGAMGKGTENRLWIAGPLPDPLPPEHHAVEVREHVKIPMRDGVRLDGVLYIPDVPTPRPCILDADGYGWSLDPRDRRFAEERGYGVANVSFRGIDESEGEAGLYDHFAQDGYDLVEWMARQPWCNGAVGIYGSSLVGIPQWQIARAAPPHLKAIAPDVACGNCYEYLWYPGGMRPGPGREARARHDYVAAIKHPDYDNWWQAQSTDAQDDSAIAAAGIAVMASGGWKDYITPGNIAAFAAFSAAGGEGRLFIDPGAHPSARRSIIGPYYHARHMDLFFDHYLGGHENAWTDGSYKGNVVIWVNGPDQYRYEASWPIPDARAVRLYLRAAESGSIESLNDGSLSTATPAADEAPVSYDYFPETGPFLPAMRESRSGTPTIDERPYEAATLTWTTPALDVPTEITGKVIVDFWASATSHDTDFVIMMSDVAPDGTSTYVSTGFLNGPHYPDRSHPRPLIPGEIRRYALETQPNARVFQQGHRIRFTLAGGVMGAPGQVTPQGPGKNPNFSTVTIYQDADHPSSLTLPVIGTALLPTQTTAGTSQE